LEEREIGGVGGGERELVYGRNNAGVGYGPFEVSGSFATDNTRRGRRGMAWI
jgi:hypothetical protein